MKKLVSSLIVLFIVLVLIAQAEELKRTSTVTDVAGITTEVTDLSFLAALQNFDNSYGCIALSADLFDIAIPIDNLISIEVKGNIHAISYLWRGKQLTITGELFDGDFKGKSDFGDFKLHSSKLRSLKFNQPPKQEEKKEEVSYRATLTLENGTRISVGKLKRHDSFYSTAGYIMGGSTRYHHYTNFSFLRGESLATIDFDKIKRIEFTGVREVSVTLKNGNMASGTISTEKGADIVGFTGVFENGKFFVPKKHVKAIEL